MRKRQRERPVETSKLLRLNAAVRKKEIRTWELFILKGRCSPIGNLRETQQIER